MMTKHLKIPRQLMLTSHENMKAHLVLFNIFNMCSVMSNSLHPHVLEVTDRVNYILLSSIHHHQDVPGILSFH